MKNSKIQRLLWSESSGMRSLYYGIGFMSLFLSLSCIRPERELSPDEKDRGVRHIFKQGKADDIYAIEKFRVMKLPSQTLERKVKRVKQRTPSSIASFLIL